jgi:endonuclease-8
VPEGDTIFRTATTLRQWLEGRRVTAARTTTAAAVHRLVGETIEEVEARGKHLLIRCTGNVTLHTHMKMSGVWHVYRGGDAWRKAAGRARVVLECGDRVAVGFDVPVVEVIERRAEHLHPALAMLGPDVLRQPVDFDEVRRRAATRPRDTTIADLLLDQGVVAGIGNIWRSEALFAERVDPFATVVTIAPGVLDRVVAVASDLMARAATATRPRARVYGRTRRPCVRCRTPISAARTPGTHRTVYWCPRCQRQEPRPQPDPQQLDAPPQPARQQRRPRP